MSNLTKVEQAEAELKAARAAYGEAYAAKNYAISAITREHDPIIREALERVRAAEDAERDAIRDNTPDHPMHGKRVFRMKPIFPYSWSREPVRHERVEGEVRTYRPGDNRPAYHPVAVGAPIVLPLLKSGKVGVKPESYDAYPWKIVDEEAGDPA